MDGHGSSVGAFKGEYDAPAHKATTIRGSFMSDESAGVKYGLSARSDLDSENLLDFKVNQQVSNSGNPRQAIVGPRGGKSVSEKGHSFKFC
jgi:hypothetical protein